VHTWLTWKKWKERNTEMINSSSGSLFFTGIVIILIVFQIAVIVQFLVVNAKLDAIIENQELIKELLNDIYDLNS